MNSSRSAKLFQKRKAKHKRDYQRRKATLLVRARVLIVCEGEKTEPLYFRALIAKLDLTTAEVEICGDCGSAPESVVEFGVEKFRMDPDFEKVFFVFDKDTHISFDNALQLVENFQKKHRKICVSAITSNPCFEFWFLLHFKLSTKPFSRSGKKSPCDNLISELKSYPGFENYEKGGRNHLDSLHCHLSRAKKNASDVLKLTGQQLPHGESKHHGCPTTFVHILVEALELLANQQKRHGSIGVSSPQKL